ncbi:hypothetical protein M2280_001323 [Prescottella agglutinans]|uniref:Uncharacterized protein n=1 Tax=Prescottella agglutinans TaxID=1644129 RepID=A0ABT6M725_9NOCA|nr:hypothetical protein [Prescottella agglutinans]
MVQEYLNRIIFWAAGVFNLTATGSKFIKNPPNK